MTRVPTYNSYMNMVSQTTALKSQLDLYSYQTTTGIRYQEYSGYGMQANSIVNLESMLGVTSNYMENNKIVSIENSAISTALTTIQETLSDFKSLLVSASGMDLDKTSTDVTGGKIVFGNDDPTAYLNQTITVNGIQYTFSNNNTGNNIDNAISLYKANAENKNITFVGDGSILYKDLLTSKLSNKLIFSNKNIQSSISLAKCAYDKYLEGLYGDSNNLSPLYLRKSQAERALVEK